jgi:hypothetical protein
MGRKASEVEMCDASAPYKKYTGTSLFVRGNCCNGASNNGDDSGDNNSDEVTTLTWTTRIRDRVESGSGHSRMPRHVLGTDTPGTSSSSARAVALEKSEQARPSTSPVAVGSAVAGT